MTRFRMWAYLGAAIALTLTVLIAPTRGQVNPEPTKAAPPGVKAKIDKADGTSIDAVVNPVLVLKADFGTIELDLSKAKTLDFASDNGKIIAIIELLDKHHLTAEPTAQNLTLSSGESIPFTSIRELKVQREKVRLSAIAFIAGLITLAIMEIVLGIDNIIFLAIVAGRLPKEEQPRARQIGLAAALGTRLVLLFSLSWLLGLTKAVFTLPISSLAPDARDISWRDIILLTGGAFLIVKSVMEMHHKLEEAKHRDLPASEQKPRKHSTFAKTIAQIAIIDIVFSLDSVITAVGMVEDVTVMVLAMIIAMGVMLAFAGPVANFVEKFPTIKVLALSFLILIGVLLVAEGMGQHVDKGYVYFAMAFGVGVELVNLLLRPKGVPQYIAGETAEAKDLEPQAPDAPSPTA